MLETLILGLFIGGLGLCIIGNFQILYALVFGMFLFGFYALKCGYSKRETIKMLFEGVSKIKNILIIFGLIGALTAVWRLSGTIPFILYYSVDLIKPEIFVLSTFLLCCLMSALIGTSMGTAGTIGVICMMISNTVRIDPLITGGAVLSGIYFGDRVSPMSSSAQLVSVLTETEIYLNIKNMVSTSIVPFVLSCVFYLLISKSNIEGEINTSYVKVLDEYFNLSYVVVIPAVLIILFAVLKINVKTSMAISIVTALVIAITVQDITFFDAIRCLFQGYDVANNEELAILLNGGGISSMIKVSFIVLISATYSGVLSRTNILSGIKDKIKFCSQKISPFGATFITSIVANSFGCNQTLGVMLTEEMCNDLYEDKYKLACALENTAIVVAPLIFWNIAGAVPIETIGTDRGCLVYACYLYLLPTWNFILGLVNMNKRKVQAIVD